jgi:hypothetical protein
MAGRDVTFVGIIYILVLVMLCPGFLGTYLSMLVSCSCNSGARMRSPRLLQIATRSAPARGTQASMQGATGCKGTFRMGEFHLLRWLCIELTPTSQVPACTRATRTTSSKKELGAVANQFQDQAHEGLSTRTTKVT